MNERKNKLFENEHFYSREVLLYIAWACLRNVIDRSLIIIHHTCLHCAILSTEAMFSAK